MRTTVTIPDSLLADLMAYTHARKRTEAVNMAIEEWIRYRKIQEIKKLRGKVGIANDWRQLRDLDKDEE